MAKTEKTTIRYAPGLLEEADALASRSGVSRNRVIELAITEFTKTKTAQDVHALDFAGRASEPIDPPGGGYDSWQKQERLGWSGAAHGKTRDWAVENGGEKAGDGWDKFWKEYGL